MPTPSEMARSAELRTLFRTVVRLEHEHGLALALLNSLSPSPPQWARDAVAAAWHALTVARRAEARALRGF